MYQLEFVARHPVRKLSPIKDQIIKPRKTRTNYLKFFFRRFSIGHYPAVTPQFARVKKWRKIVTHTGCLLGAKENCRRPWLNLSRTQSLKCNGTTIYYGPFEPENVVCDGCCDPNAHRY